MREGDCIGSTDVGGEFFEVVLNLFDDDPGDLALDGVQLPLHVVHSLKHVHLHLSVTNTYCVQADQRIKTMYTRFQKKRCVKKDLLEKKIYWKKCRVFLNKVSSGLHGDKGGIFIEKLEIFFIFFIFFSYFGGVFFGFQ